MFVNSIIIKISWIVLPFQNAENNCLLMYDTLAQEEEQGRHTNVMKTYYAAETNPFIFSTHQFPPSPFLSLPRVAVTAVMFASVTDMVFSMSVVKFHGCVDNSGTRCLHEDVLCSV